MKDSYGFIDLSKTLGMASPLLMLDSLVVDSEGRRAEGLKCVSAGEEVFRGHFPERPILPGVLQVASMLQASKMLFFALHGRDGEVGLARLRRVKFRRPVLPGAVLRVVVEEQDATGDGAEFKASCLLENGDVASDGRLVLCRREPGWFSMRRRGEAVHGLAPDAVISSNHISPEGASSSIETASEPNSIPFSGVEEIMRVIPHRNPFLLLDGARVEDDGRISGFKNATGNEPMVRATASGVYPAFLQMESCAQLGCWAALARPENSGKLGIFLSIDEATVLRPVWAGERFSMGINLDYAGKYGTALCHGTVSGEPVLEVSLKFAII